MKIIYLENQPNEICSHLSEKASKGRFLKPEKLQNHSNEGKGKEEKKKKKKCCTLSFYNSYFGDVGRKRSISKIQLDIYRKIPKISPSMYKPLQI